MNWRWLILKVVVMIVLGSGGAAILLWIAYVGALAASLGP